MATPKDGLQHPRPARVLNLRRIESFSDAEGKGKFRLEQVAKDRMLGSSCDGPESTVVAGAGKAGKAAKAGKSRSVLPAKL